MISVKRTEARVLAMAALAGLAVTAKALADCPELEQLQRAYFDASQQIREPKALPRTSPSPPSKKLCETYGRLAETTKAWIEYARQHNESCRLSGLLPMMEREYSRTVEYRDNICAGRPARPGFSIFPAEIHHWEHQRLRRENTTP